jgi:hypothetical protein
MKGTIRRSVAVRITGLVLAAGAVTAAGALAPGAASAHPAGTTSPDTVTACGIGQVPLTNQNTWVRSGPGFAFGPIYTIPAWFGFRIVAGPATADGLVWWYGHGNGQDNGWVPQQNLTCA